ncbi:MAG: hypothetical protein ACHQAX_02945 [Gammaproteobacteria bacterium]
MSNSLWGWGKLLGEAANTNESLALTPVDFKESIKKINMIEKNMLASINTIGEPDYIGEFIERGGLIGLEPMGFNAHSEITPDASHTRLAQVALNHSRLESSLNNFKKALTQTFETLNQSMSENKISFDASAQQALADMVTHREHAKGEIKSLVLKPKTVETMYACFERIASDTQELQKEFERCARAGRSAKFGKKPQ